MLKPVLIITYYWPPAGGPGVQRWLKFVKYLPDFNIKPIVYIPENPNYPLIDESLTSEVSKDLTILKLPISEPYRWAGFFSKKTSKTISKGIIPEQKKQRLVEKLMLYIRGNFFIPDARKGWVQPSVVFLSEYITKHNIKTIITTGPPHSLHVIGLHLKQKLDIKWLADFRDPWTTIGYHKQLKLNKASKEKHKTLEKQVLNTADQLIVTSWATKKEFQQKTDIPITVITNGYDDEGTEVEAPELDSKFSMAHIGSLLSKRNPEVLWQILSELVNDDAHFAKDLQINLIGSVSESVLCSIDSYNLSDYTNNMGYMSHEASINYQKKSQILLLIEIDSEDTKSIIPGKLFEYMASNRPILAIGPKDSDVASIINDTHTGNYYFYHSHDAIKAIILKHYRAYKKSSLTVSPVGLQQYHRKSLTKSLSQLL